MEDKKITIAFAVENGNFINNHFGDCNSYQLYQIGKDGKANFIKEIINIAKEDDEEDENHGDIKKAKNISSYLKKYGVNILAARVFGANLKKVSQKFICLIINRKIESIDSAISIIESNYYQELNNNIFIINKTDGIIRVTGPNK